VSADNDSDRGLVAEIVPIDVRFVEPGIEAAAIELARDFR
jgi:hypothetical protein